eukprot:338261-Amphidinium_carterae.2
MAMKGKMLPQDRSWNMLVPMSAGLCSPGCRFKTTLTEETWCCSQRVDVAMCRTLPNTASRGGVPEQMGLQLKTDVCCHVTYVAQADAQCRGAY